MVDSTVKLPQNTSGYYIQLLEQLETAMTKICRQEVKKFNGWSRRKAFSSVKSFLRKSGKVSVRSRVGGEH